MKSRQDFETTEKYHEYLKTYFSAIAMQGILAAQYEANPVLHTPSPADTIQDAIRYADELLKQLES